MISFSFGGIPVGRLFFPFSFGIIIASSYRIIRAFVYFCFPSFFPLYSIWASEKIIWLLRCGLRRFVDMGFYLLFFFFLVLGNTMHV
jgi:hypothetical protein